MTTANATKKDMQFVDDSLFKTVFKTKVHIKQVYSKTKDKWFTVIQLGEDQDKTIIVGSRKDGKGTTLSTDWVDYQKSKTGWKDTVVEA